MELSESEVMGFLARAPYKYRVYTIPKRTAGHRVIAQPTKTLKAYQRAFLSLFELKIHDCAMAYRKGLSIRDNANQHKNNRYLLKLDLENFFNSITHEIFWDVWQKHYQMPFEKEKLYMEKLLFWSPSKTLVGKLVLSIGAPTSPMLSNFFMYEFDGVISTLCTRQGVTYTRYADDLTFSTNYKDVLFNIPKLVSAQLSELFGGALVVNRRKTIFSSKAHNRHVTGITIDNKGNLSLGRERKRYIKHLVNQYQFDQLDKEDIYHLKGLLAFAKHVEPLLIARLELKYSAKLIAQIFEEHYE